MTTPTTETTTVNLPADVLADLLVWHLTPLVDEDEDLPPEVVTAWLALMVAAPEIAAGARRELAQFDPDQLERLDVAIRAVADGLKLASR